MTRQRMWPDIWGEGEGRRHDEGSLDRCCQRPKCHHCLLSVTTSVSEWESVGREWRIVITSTSVSVSVCVGCMYMWMCCTCKKKIPLPENILWCLQGFCKMEESGWSWKILTLQLWMTHCHLWSFLYPTWSHDNHMIHKKSMHTLWCTCRHVNEKEYSQ